MARWLPDPGRPAARKAVPWVGPAAGNVGSPPVVETRILPHTFGTPSSLGQSPWQGKESARPAVSHGRRIIRMRSLEHIAITVRQRTNVLDYR